MKIPQPENQSISAYGIVSVHTDTAPGEQQQTMPTSCPCLCWGEKEQSERVLSSFHTHAWDSSWQDLTSCSHKYPPAHRLGPGWLCHGRVDTRLPCPWAGCTWCLSWHWSCPGTTRPCWGFAHRPSTGPFLKLPSAECLKYVTCVPVEGKKKKREREKDKTRGLVTEQTYLVTWKLLKLDFSRNVRDNTKKTKF